MEKEKFNNIAPISLPWMTAELEDVVQGWKNAMEESADGINRTIVRLILQELTTSGDITPSEARRLWGENFSRPVRKVRKKY